MISNLPRDVEYLIFWRDDDLGLLDDPPFSQQTRVNHREFQQEYLDLSKILQRYPNVFNPETYSFDNFKWIYSHLVTRCFGKYLCYVTMVPFAEFLNHECSDVYYDFYYEPHNPYRPKNPSADDHRWLTQEDEDDAPTSEESYESQDPLSDTEFQYDGLDLLVANESSTSNNNCSFQSENLNKSSSVPVQSKPSDIESYNEKSFLSNKVFTPLEQQIRDIKQWLFNNIDYGDSFSIFYVAQVKERLNSLAESQFENVRAELGSLQGSNTHYKRELYKYYNETSKMVTHICSPVLEQKRSRSSREDSNIPVRNSGENNSMEKFQSTKEEEKMQEEFDNIPDEDDFLPDEKWEDDKFDYFVMKTSEKDTFEDHTQMYFCYGRLSNRLLLFRYGCSIEFNKYDHVHIRINYLDYLGTEGKRIVTENLLSKYKRFKIKITKFNFDILNFFKATLWRLGENLVDSLVNPSELKLELLALAELQKYYENWLEKCRFTIEENEKILKNSIINSHEYFSAIYRVERQRIIKNQLILVKVAGIILSYLNKGAPLDIAVRKTEFEVDEEEKERNRYLLAPYLRRLRLWGPLKK
jgi:hypothetical protein